MVIDKPAGLPVDTPRRGGESIVSRLDELRAGFKAIAELPDAHRLDQDTSGCLLLARSPKAPGRCSSRRSRRAPGREALSGRSRERSDRGQGMIDLPLAKISSAEAGWRMVGDPAGQRRAPAGRDRGRDGPRRWSSSGRVTGRTHQIRVHAREAFGRGSSATGSTAFRAAPMLLHASRLVVPREGKPDDRCRRAPARRFRRWRVEAEDVIIPEDALSETFLAASGPGGQNVNKVATAVAPRRCLPPRSSPDAYAR